MTNPKATGNAGRLIVQTFIQGVYTVDIGRVEATFTVLPGSVTATAAIEVSNPVTYGADSVYVLRFMIDHSVPKSGIIALDIPQPFGIDDRKILQTSALCQKNDLFFCTSIPERTLELRTREEISAGSEVTIELDGLRNPRTFEETEEFFIVTYSANFEYEIDRGYSMRT